jgi:hypothetical protein
MCGWDESSRPTVWKSCSDRDTCQYRTILHAEPPRAQCPTKAVPIGKTNFGPQLGEYDLLLGARP